MLWHQAQLSTVNEPIGGQLPFNESSDAVVLSLKASIDKLKTAEVDYSKQLASTEKERLAMEAKDRAVKKQFETVQAMFTAEEANVYLQRAECSYLCTWLPVSIRGE